MSKTVKGARVRHRRTSVAGVIPTIPANDDHTTGWIDTDIYIGEFFMNTSVSTPGIWFRDVSGTTRVATLDKITGKLPISQLTSNNEVIDNIFTTSTTITNTILTTTQNIVINSESDVGLTCINDIELNNLEDRINVIHISLNVKLNTGNLEVNIKGSTGIIISENTDVLKGIILMWNGSDWVILSNVTNV